MDNAFDAYDRLAALFEQRLTAEVAVLEPGGDWQDAATLGGVLDYWACTDTTSDGDVYIDGNYALHIPWPKLTAHSWEPSEDLPGAMTLVLAFGTWRVRFTTTQDYEAA